MRVIYENLFDRVGSVQSNRLVQVGLFNTEFNYRDWINRKFP
jgi:hypothetical protein